MKQSKLFLLVQLFKCFSNMVLLLFFSVGAKVLRAFINSISSIFSSALVIAFSFSFSWFSLPMALYSKFIYSSLSITSQGLTSWMTNLLSLSLVALLLLLSVWASLSLKCMVLSFTLKLQSLKYSPLFIQYWSLFAQWSFTSSPS